MDDILAIPGNPAAFRVSRGRARIMVLLWSLLTSFTVASILSCIALGSDMFFAAAASFDDAFNSASALMRMALDSLSASAWTAKARFMSSGRLMSWRPALAMSIPHSLESLSISSFSLIQRTWMRKES